MTMILVAEDDVLLLGAIRDTLELDGYSVCGVTNGLEALEAFRRFRPKLVVTDVTMPGMDGFQLYCRVRRESPDAVIPFVFISARDAARAIEQVARNNRVCFLRKPFGPEELLGAVCKFLERHGPILSSPADLSPIGTVAVEKGDVLE